MELKPRRNEKEQEKYGREGDEMWREAKNTRYRRGGNEQSQTSFREEDVEDKRHGSNRIMRKKKSHRKSAISCWLERNIKRAA